MDVKGTIERLAGHILKPLRSPGDVAGQRVTAAHDITVESDSFAPGGRIPDAFAGGDGRSPSLRWSGVPEDTREVVVLAEDPDAPMPKPFVHWIVTGIPADITELDEGLPATAAPLDNGIQQGRNSAGRDGYYGPEPPRGHGVHHYHFQVFALDARVDVSAPIERDRLVEAMRDHVVGVGEVIGTYER